MKRLLPSLLIVSTIALAGGTAYFLYESGKPPVETFRTATVSRADLQKKTVASGSVVPRNEVMIKPAVSGVIASLAVEPGDVVEAGALIAVIRIIPDAASVANAEARLAETKLNFADADSLYKQNQELLTKGAVSARDVEQSKLARDLAARQRQAARDNLQIIKEGTTSRSGLVSNEVRATVSGMILAVDVEVGASVIESNTFNEGTTIAHIADMEDLVFEGFVDESDVGKVSEGMPISLSIGALPESRFDGSLEYISPKGMAADGTTRFEIRASLTPVTDIFIRAGMSANADIVLDARSDVLTIPESTLVFEGPKTFVEREGAEGMYTKLPVELGLSDGLSVEVVSGVEEGDALKIQYGRR